MLLIQYTYLHRRPTSAVAVETPIPEKDDAVFLRIDDAGAIYAGTIASVAEPAIDDGDQVVPYLLYVNVPTGQPRIHELAQHVDDGGDVELMLDR
jgi:hypothetical protein